MPDFDAFLTKMLQRPLPSSAISRVRVLAKELAEGAVEEVWPSYLSVNRANSHPDPETGQYIIIYEMDDPNLRAYFKQRWDDNAPKLSLLVDNGYLQTDITNRYIDGYKLIKPAFDLLEAVEPASIFISYKRRESSAFALLVLARLKEHSLNAFVDLTIQPGDNWQTHLKEQIQKRDYFVLLLSKTSLDSQVVHQEIQWALESGSAILPIWHGGFVYKSGDFTVPPEIDHLLNTTHTIRVLEESALAYNNAIIELLNRFGITP